MSMNDTNIASPASAIEIETAASATVPGTIHDSPSPKFAHLDERARSLLDAPLVQRIAHTLSDAIVIHPALETLLNEVRWMIREPTRFRARGLILYAPPGNGKTAVSEILCRQFPLSAKASRDKRCVVAISLAGARTTRTIFERIHEALGTELGKGTVSYAEQRVHAMLRECGCRLLILDEAQDLLGAREGEQQRVIESVKHLMNRLRLPILALGTERAVKAFKADTHMQARFKAMPLPAWKADAELESFLRQYEKHLPFACPSRLDNPLIIKHLVDISGGVLDPMLSCIKNTAVRLLANGASLITLADLQATALRPNVSVLDALK